MIGNYFWGGAAAPYAIEQSLRFNNGDSAHLHRTPGSAGSQTTFTLSVWVKSSVPSSGSEYFYATHNGSRWNAILRRSGNYDFGVDESGGSAPKVVTNAKLRDPSAWYHLVMAYDTTQATSTNRVKIWINGELQSINTGAGSYPNLNHGSTFNRAVKHWIGALDDTASVYYTKDFYLAEYHLLDGTAVTNAEDFGEYDDNNVWRPIEYTGGNYGTVGYYLKFDPTATNGIGHDHSGNGNNWTASGFTTTGTGTDVMSDTPTTNWATINPLSKDGGTTLSEGNLSISSANYGNNTATFFLTSGKWYWEAQGTGYVGAVCGNVGQNHGTSISASGSNSIGYWYDGGTVYYDGGNTTGGAGYTASDVIGVAADMDSGTLKFYKNNVEQYDLTFGSGGVPDLSSGLFPCYNNGSGGGTKTVTFNFGQRAFAYTPPTNFLPLNTSNLPAPNIADGSDYFNTVLYTGNGSTQSITGVGFQPDWVWVKGRSVAAHHVLTDAVRGANKQLWSNRTAGDQTSTLFITSFDSDGFSVGDSSVGFGNVNTNNDTFVAWNWLAGGTGSSNTTGSITSTVSANPSAGFSIVSYTGTTAAATVGHGLGVAPSLVLVKIRSQAGNWQGYHASLGKDYTIKLNTTDAQENIANYWGTGGVTSTVFGVIGGGYGNNVNGATHIAYCFAEVEGYSKFGSYTGNGATSANSGPFVYLGFKPSMVIIKRTDGAGGGWAIWDNKRNTYNIVDNYLFPNTNGSEADGNGSGWWNLDFLSNGFRVQSFNESNTNASGGNYIYMAFAENPFGGSGVSPATSR